MSILSKVKKIVSGDEDVVVPEKAPAKKRATKKTSASAVVAGKGDVSHDHASHEGHDHDHDRSEGAPQSTSLKHERPQSVAAAIGFGAAGHIIRPLITEKGTIAAQKNTYIFQVAIAANKPAIKQAIEKIYNVKVTHVRTLRQDGKVVRYGRIAGRRSNFKKAYVTVAEGQTITVHKGV